MVLPTLCLKAQLGLAHATPLIVSHASSLLLNEVQVFESMDTMISNSLQYIVFIAFLVVPVILLNRVIAPKLNMIDAEEKKDFF